MKLAILDCCTLDDPKLKKYDGIGQLVANWLSPYLPEATIDIYMIADGAAFPKIEDYDCFLLPGSECGVYDTRTWMEPLRKYLLNIRDSRKPLFGICFGHQMMAHTFGGRAQKVNLGYCAGTRSFTVHGETVEANVGHQDQVVEVPPSAKVVGGADYCPNAVLEYEFPAMSFQFHPEYPSAFVKDLVDVLEGGLLSSEEAAAARQSISESVRSDLYGEQVKQFFLSNTGSH